MSSKFKVGDTIRHRATHGGETYTVIATVDGGRHGRDTVVNWNVETGGTYLIKSDEYEVVSQTFSPGKMYNSPYGTIIRVVAVLENVGAVGWTCKHEWPHDAIAPWSKGGDMTVGCVKYTERP